MSLSAIASINPLDCPVIRPPTPASTSIVDLSAGECLACGTPASFAWRTPCPDVPRKPIAARRAKAPAKSPPGPGAGDRPAWQEGALECNAVRRNPLGLGRSSRSSAGRWRDYAAPLQLKRKLLSLTSERLGCSEVE
jgi:hypothetical protein